MNLKFNKKAILLVFAGVASLFAILTALLSQLGFIFVPFVTAALATVFLMETGKRPIFSISLSVGFILLDVVFSGVYSFNCLCSVLMSAVIYLYFARRKINRTECGAICTAISALFLLALFLLAAAYTVKSFDPALIREYIEEAIAEGRAAFLAQIEAMPLPEGGASAAIDTEAIAEMFDLSVNIALSFFVILGFLLAGITMKLFRAFLGFIATDKTPLATDRFNPSSVFAYFYIVLSLLAIFTDAKGGVFSLTVLNLYYVFMFVFAYMGISYFSVLIRARVRRGAGLITAAAVLFALLSPGLGVQLLATFGVLFNIVFNKRISVRTSSGDGDRKE